MLKFNYTQDGYYRRIPLMEEHQQFITGLETGDTRVWGSNSFPADSRILLLQTDKSKEELEATFESDPYVKKGTIFSEMTVTEYYPQAIREFNTIASDFLYRP